MNLSTAAAAMRRTPILASTSVRDSKRISISGTAIRQHFAVIRVAWMFRIGQTHLARRGREGLGRVSDDTKKRKAESRSPEHASASRVATPSLNDVATKVIGHLRRLGNDALAERFLAALALW